MIYKLFINSIGFIPVPGLELETYVDNYESEKSIRNNTIITLLHKTRIGNAIYNPGCYRIQHIENNGDCYIEFRKMNTNEKCIPGKPGYGSMCVSCKLDQFHQNTERVKLQEVVDAAGESVIEELLIKNRNTRYIWPSPFIQG